MDSKIGSEKTWVRTRQVLLDSHAYVGRRDEDSKTVVDTARDVPARLAQKLLRVLRVHIKEVPAAAWLHSDKSLLS